MVRSVTYTKVLRRFERISLQPGEETTVRFELGPQELGLWDKNMDFTVEPGHLKVKIGAPRPPTFAWRGGSR